MSPQEAVSFFITKKPYKQMGGRSKVNIEDFIQALTMKGAKLCKLHSCEGYTRDCSLDELASCIVLRAGKTNSTGEKIIILQKKVAQVRPHMVTALIELKGAFFLARSITFPLCTRTPAPRSPGHLHGGLYCAV